MATATLGRRRVCACFLLSHRPGAAAPTLPALHRSTSRRKQSNTSSQERRIHAGHSTIDPQTTSPVAQLPFYFDTGFALFAKRRSRPFPPPFLSAPSGSFSDPLSTHDRSQDRRPHVNNELIRGVTNGDDAVIAEQNFVGANDGVGAWVTRKRGHAALWSRLILHFWAREAELALLAGDPPDPIRFLQKAFDATKEATLSPEVYGTTTACAALLHHADGDPPTPRLYVTNVGDSQIMVIRPSTRDLLYKTKEQWHWFDCPRQLGTNSPDTPTANAVCDAVDIREDDVVLAMSDGVPDNLWEHEIVENVVTSLAKVQQESSSTVDGRDGGMMWVAEELVKATKAIAEDPFAESPFMERAVEEGLAMEGGKMDDISVVAAVCRKRKS